MVKARASVSLAGSAHRRGVSGRTHEHRGLRARRLVSTGPQDVQEAFVGVDTTPRRGRAARRDLPAISLSPLAGP
jgi:hypothetical protein